MSCAGGRRAQTALEALFLGSVEPKELEWLLGHAAGCARCREAYDRVARVHSALEGGRALSEARARALEQAVLARATAPAAAPARAPGRTAAPRAPWGGWLRVAVPAMAVAALALLLVPPLLRREHPAQDAARWQARGVGDAAQAFGVRAFCVAEDGAVRGEAAPGGRLACPAGAVLQLSYTAPRAARLVVEGQAPGGERLQFFPREGAAAPVSVGTDVPLSHSTPVTRDWLAAPLVLRARFLDPSGATLAESELTLTP